MPVYFAYGANMDPHHMVERVPGARPLAPGRLDGYRLVFNVYSDEWEGGAANLDPDERSHVWGMLWEVEEAETAGLDAFHGHPSYFRMEDVIVETKEGPVVAWTYRIAHVQGFVRPTDRYLQRLHSAIRVQGLPPEALDIVDRAARPPYPTIST